MFVAKDLLIVGSNLALAGGEFLALGMLRRRSSAAGSRVGLTVAIVVAGALTVLDLAWEAMENRAVPLQSLRESLLWFSLVVMIAAEATHRMARASWGAAVLLPAAFCVQTLSLFFPQWFASREALGMLGNSLSALHVGLFLASYAALLVSAGCSSVFLIVDRRLKSDGKSLALRSARGLARLDEMATRAAGLGVVLLLLAIGLSVVLLMQYQMVRGGAALAMLFADFTIWSSFLIWLYFCAFLALRLRFGWVGRRGSMAIVMGAMLLVTVYFGGKLIPRGSLHGFAAPRPAQGGQR